MSAHPPARLKVQRRLILLAASTMALDGCRAADPRLTTELVYRGTVLARVHAVHLDQRSLFGQREIRMYVSPVAIKHEARFLPGFARVVPEQVHARWTYQETDPTDSSVRYDRVDENLPWLPAEDSTELRARMPAEDLARLARAPDRHRLRLELIFDRAKLRVQASVRQWR
ncbi:MAG: hypothetical protein WCY32_08820 [Burkholderiaceae bacterium]